MTLSILNYLTNIDNNSKFLLTVIIIIIVLLILIFIFNYLSNKQVRRQRKLVREINKDAKHIEPIKVRKEDKKEKAVDLDNSNKKIEIEEKLIVSEPTVVNKNISVVQDEIETIQDEEIIEVLQDDNESDIDRILREIKQASKEDSINLTEFEKEQEETAIISYDELCKRAGVKKKIYKANKEEEKVPIEATVNDSKKYKPTKFVSPIYGIQDAKTKNDNMDLDQTFLQNLKEFRSTLDL